MNTLFRLVLLYPHAFSRADLPCALHAHWEAARDVAATSHTASPYIVQNTSAYVIGSPARFVKHISR